MPQVQVHERVRLTQDIPGLQLHRGDVGLVCSTWFAPTIACEVEFERTKPQCPVRTLLMLNQISG